MRDKRYTLTESDKKRLERQVERLEAAPPPAMLPSKFSPADAAPDGYWALPPCETGLPKASRDIETGSLTPGMAMCCLYQYNSDYRKLLPVNNATGFPVKVLVKNFYTQTINDHVQIWRHKDGTWANEQPMWRTLVTTEDYDRTLLFSPVCEGECVWVATQQLEWSGPVGGCRNTTTTTTTVAPATTTVTTTLIPTTTTLPPCPTTNCRLRCVATTPGPTTTPGAGTTTSAPTTVWPPVPSAVGRYQVIGTTCALPCSCYGVNEPCFVLNGEIESKCVYVNLTTTTLGPTTTTTTSGPVVGIDACQIIQNVLGTVPPLHYRAAAKLDGIGGWQVCQTCPDGFVPIRPLGGDEPEQPAGYVGAVYHQSRCIPNPCSRVIFDDPDEYERMEDQYDAASGSVFAAYTYAELLQVLQGVENYDELTVTEDGKYLANWFLCSGCAPSPWEGPQRTYRPPEPWLYIDTNQNLNRPLELKVNSRGIYQYVSPCIEGFDCDNCKYVSPYSKIPTTLPPISNTTPAPSTTPPPCSCWRPSHCPTVEGECTKTLCGPGGGVNQEIVQCPATTPYPGHFCLDRWCGVCHCDAGTVSTTTTTTTTVIPCSGQCEAAIIAGVRFNWNGPGLGSTGAPVPVFEETRNLVLLKGCDVNLAPGMNPNLFACSCKWPCTWPWHTLGYNDCTTTSGPFNPLPTTTPTLPPCGSVMIVPCEYQVYTTEPPTPCTNCIGTCLWGASVRWRPTQTGGEYVVAWQRLTVYMSYIWWDYQQNLNNFPNGVGCRAVGPGRTPCAKAIEPGPPGPGTSLFSSCYYNGLDWDDFWWWAFYHDTGWSYDMLGCGCPVPPGQPGFCSVVETGCSPRLNICNCCNQAGPSDPCGQECTFRGNGYGGWTKIYDPCPTNCPCPVGPAWSSGDECDSMNFRCGSIVWTTGAPPSTPTTATTTTVAPGACCYPGGKCQLVHQRYCLTGLGGVWQGPGTVCGGTICNSFTTTSTTAEPPGACCYSLGTVNLVCTYASRSFCQNVFGQFNPGVGCAGGNAFCNPTTTTGAPLKACCNALGECLLTVEGDTNCMPGTWGLGNFCSGGSCSGRCCLTCTNGDKFCVDNTSRGQCQAYAANGTLCGGVPGSYEWAVYTVTNPIFCNNPLNPCTTTTTTTTGTPPSTPPPT